MLGRQSPQTVSSEGWRSKMVLPASIQEMMGTAKQKSKGYRNRNTKKTAEREKLRLKPKWKGSCFSWVVGSRWSTTANPHRTTSQGRDTAMRLTFINNRHNSVSCKETRGEMTRVSSVFARGVVSYQDSTLSHELQSLIKVIQEPRGLQRDTHAVEGEQSE